MNTLFKLVEMEFVRTSTNRWSLRGASTPAQNSQGGILCSGERPLHFRLRADIREAGVSLPE